MNIYVNDYNSTVQVYNRELKKEQYNPLTKEQEQELFNEIIKNNSKKAKDKIIQSNLRFVFDIAKKYKGYGVSMSELISEGNNGLMIALSKFDPSRDIKFLSYAVWWIKVKMINAIKKQQEIKSRENREDDLFTKIETVNCDLENDEVLYKQDVIMSNQNDYENNNTHNEQRVMVDKLLETLDERTKKIVIERYGLLNGKTKTLQEISAKFGLSKERTRQIIEKGLHKLRSEALVFSFQ